MNWFGAPWMLYGLVFASIPIIIHLLNRRRFMRIDWAPMKYLKLTLRTNRRKLRLEQWLLLAVRTLVLILLFMALARPVISGGARWLGGKGRAARVLVIDDSPSMAETTEGVSALDRAKQIASDLIRETSAKDQLTVFTTSSPATPLVRHTQLDSPGELLAAVDRLQTTDIAGQWSATLNHVEERLQEAAYSSHQVVLITDLQRSDWATDVDSISRMWADRELNLQVVDVSRPPTNNVALESLQMRSPVAIVGQPFQLVAVVHNHSSEVIEGMLATLTVAGVEQTVEIPKTLGGQSAVLTMSGRVDTAGQQLVRLTLPADQQPSDDRRHLVLDVKENVAVLLVDGEPGEGLQSETGFLRAALASGRAPWQVDVVDDLQWQDLALDRFDVVVLTNVSVLSEERAEALQRHVSQGHGLVIFPGELLDHENYNRLLGPQGKALLPAPLEPWQPLEGDDKGVNIAGLSDSPLAVLAAAPQLVAEIKPRQIQQVKMADASSAADDDRAEVRVLATWNTPSQPPLLIEKRVGSGRVFLWTVTADRQWSDWPQDPSYVLAMRETTLAAARQTATLANVLAGQTLTTAVPAQQPPGQGEVALPNGEKQNVPLEVGDPQQPTMSFANTLRTGAYEIHWQQSGRSVQRRFAVNVAPQESDPQRVSETRLRNLFDPLPMQLTVASNDNAVSSGREIWRAVLWGMLVLLGLECALAAWVSRERVGGPETTDAVTLPGGG